MQNYLLLFSIPLFIHIDTLLFLFFFLSRSHLWLNLSSPFASFYLFILSCWLIRKGKRKANNSRAQGDATPYIVLCGRVCWFADARNRRFVFFLEGAALDTHHRVSVFTRDVSALLSRWHLRVAFCDSLSVIASILNPVFSSLIFAQRLTSFLSRQ